MITPRCTGSTPKACATGTMSGATTMIAEKISITQPSTTMTRFKISRKIQGESIAALIHTVSRSGTCSVIRRFEADGRTENQEHAADQQAALGQDLDQRFSARQSRLTIAATRVA